MELRGTAQKQLSAFPFHCSFNEKFAEVQLPSVTAAPHRLEPASTTFPTSAFKTRPKLMEKQLFQRPPSHRQAGEVSSRSDAGTRGRGNTSTHFRGISGNRTPSEIIQEKVDTSVRTSVSNHRSHAEPRGEDLGKGSARRTGRQRDTSERPRKRGPTGREGPGTRGAGHG